MHRLICLFSLLLITACSPAGDTHSEEIEIPEQFRHLDQITAYSSENPPAFSIDFEDPQRFEEVYQVMVPMARGPKTAVDDEGNVYITNLREKRVDVYRPDGSLKEYIGRDGKGPGEFTSPPVIEIQAGRLIAYDISQRRIQIFTMDPFQVEQVVNMDPSELSRFEEVRGGMNFTGTLSRETFLTGALLDREDDRSWMGYYVMNGEGKVVSDKIHEAARQRSHNWTMENGMAAGIPLPYTSQGIVSVSDGGLIYTAETSHFLISIYHPEEGYLRSIYYPFENDPLEMEEIEELYVEFRVGKMREAGLTETWPALESLMVDDENRIWVSTIVDDKKIYRWWVLDGDGKLLGRFNWTRDEEIELVKGGHMYVREKNPEEGIETVVRYKIAMQPYESGEALK